MSSKGHKRDESGKGSNEQKQGAQFLHLTITEHELATLKNVFYGYLGFLRHLIAIQPQWRETLVRVQAVHDHLPEHPETNDITYFSHEERITILEAVIAFKFLLVTTFPQTAHRDAALAEVERLYQCLLNARSLPLN